MGQSFNMEPELKNGWIQTVRLTKHTKDPGKKDKNMGKESIRGKKDAHMKETGNSM